MEKFANKIRIIHSGTKIPMTIFLLFCSLYIKPQNVLDRAGLTVSTLATVCYSMRLLSSGYAGSAVQVRRSSDNTTQNIGFTVNGDLDTATLKTFVGGGNGYVTTWYDQSGNLKHLAQAVNSSQPLLVIAGVIIREKGQPFIAFYGAGGSSYNSLDLVAEITTVGHVSAVHRFASGGDGFILGNSGSYYWHSSSNSLLLESGYTSASILSGSAWTNGAPATPISITWPTTLTMNELAPATPGSGTTWDNIGRDRVFHHITGGGGYSELIVFPVVLPNSNRNSLEFGQAAYYSIMATLPVTWLGFTAQFKVSDVLLKWQTASEQNSKEYIVQHSIDGNHFESIATISASGNSNNIRRYQYLHTAPVNGFNYYRLLQKDLDDKLTYSSIVKIKFADHSPSFTILGNPVLNNQLNVTLKEPLFLSLYAANGKLVWNKQFLKGPHVINVNGYEKGMYLIKSNSHTEKILIK